MMMVVVVVVDVVERMLNGGNIASYLQSSRIVESRGYQ